MAQMSSISVIVDSDLKQCFFATAHEHGCSGTALIRAFMQAFADGSRDLDSLQDQVHADLEHPAQVNTPTAAFQLVRRIANEMLTVNR
ncbi:MULTISPECIES: hypothetical protein [Comamonas]|uniref:hypothetical protein n=1 Tax=Comamonas TaxID=283 RepID=UPI00257FB7DB|nr:MULTISPECIES: hypothetical protein [Comamonas]